MQKRATQIIYLVGGWQIGTHIYQFMRTCYNTEYHGTPLKQRLNEKYGGEGQWALITGSSEGIGRSYALELAKAGYNLKICARSVDKLEGVAREAKMLNPAIKTEIVRLDVSNAEPGDFGKLFNENQPTSIVVSNAGIMKNKFFLKTDPALIESMIKTNVHPYVYMAKYAALHFIANKEKHNH